MTRYKSGLIGPSQKGKLPFTVRSDRKNVENEVPRCSGTTLSAPKEHLSQALPVLLPLEFPEKPTGSFPRISSMIRLRIWHHWRHAHWCRPSLRLRLKYHDFVIMPAFKVVEIVRDGLLSSLLVFAEERREW